MPESRSVTIVGGGLAGLTLGIGLRQRDVPVAVIEAGCYPRHRVCGEFISGRGLGTLRRLGLYESLIEAGASVARSVGFCSSRKSCEPRNLPTPALCISRHLLDELLAREFLRLGGHLRVGERWHGDRSAEGVVLASGRMPHSGEEGGSWFGIKIHARNVQTVADLEMHLFADGYIGVCKVSPDTVNVCGLFRRRDCGKRTACDVRERLSGPRGSLLQQRLAGVQIDESTFCSVAGLSYRPQRVAMQTACCIGDALTMTPPVTGNGMSMAFEAAELALPPLTAYSEAKLDWPEARHLVAQNCDAAFTRRLRWAGWLHRLLFVPAVQETLALKGPLWLWTTLFAKTR